MEHAAQPSQRRAAYAALGLLTLIWGGNWIAMKLALRAVDPMTFNVQRTWVAIVVLFLALFWQRRAWRPNDWVAIVVTGFFQTTINFGATTMAQ